MARAVRWLAWSTAALMWIGSLVLAVAPLAADHGTRLWDPWLARIGAAVATWLAVLLLARRIGGPLLLVAAFSGACAVLVVLVPRGWVLSAGAVVAATSYGLLGMVMTRPTAGLRSVREAVVAGVFGAAGAVVVTGYDVALRPYRFQMMVLALTLLAALAIAWRLGSGFHSLGRRGLALIVGAVGVLGIAVVYVQAVRHWGSSEAVGSFTGTNGRIRDWLGVSPRPIEALVGFPATVWGVAVRNRRRQGWWMSAFGSLAGAGVATSLVGPSLTLEKVAEATGYNLLIGVVLGLVLISVDRLLTGTGRRSHVPGGPDTERPEPSRAARLL
ncbi:MAG: hypothetical protein M3O94_02825 [Actinomycetota bacterium]|nr:hypothetical protein [Actinomycetota bacterium]